MDKAQRTFICKILDDALDITIATNRDDGWPQATCISFVHDGLVLYAGLGPEGQKANNIARDHRVSIVATPPYRTWSEIRGLSMAAVAERVTDKAETEKIGALMMKRFGSEIRDLGPIDAVNFSFTRFRPKVISILDYKKGFGHTDLVTVTDADLA